MNSEMGLAVFLIVIGGVLLAGGIVMQVFFLLSLQRALERCAPQNRTLEPGKVWLCLVPLFNIVWIFVVVGRVSSSLGREFASRHAPPEDYGRSIGLAYCILVLTSIIPYLGVLTGLAGLVCFIIYWAKISDYSRKLQQTGPFAAAGPAQAEAYPLPEPPFDPVRAWLVLVILMFAWGAQHFQTVGMSVLAPVLRDQFALTSQELGWLFSAFMFGLIAGYIVMTVVTALGGTRWGLVIALAGASLAAAGSGLASGLGGLIAARALVGFFTGGLLPAAIQSLREFFPSRLRPVAIGLFLASSPLVGLVAPLLFAYITARAGWRPTIILTAVPTVIAAALCWFAWQPPPPREPSRGVTGVGVVSVVMLAVGVLLAALLNMFTVSWLPMFLRRELEASQTTLSAIGLAAGAGGAILAGVAAWLMMRAGVSAWKTRAVLLTLFGLMLPVVALGGTYATAWSLVVVSAMVMLAYEGWSTLLYSAAADTLPARGVAIGAAIGALMATLGGALVFPVFGNMVGELGFRFVLGILAAVAALGLLCVGLLAWLVRPKSPLHSAAAHASG